MVEDKRVSELANRAARMWDAYYTHFLEASMVPLVQKYARDTGVRATLFGGYESAERVMAAFHPAGMIPKFPISVIEISWIKKFGDIGHRDVLGSVMALGIEREVTGDIVMDDGKAYIFCETDMLSYICANLTSAGHTTVKAKAFEGELTLPEPEGELFRVTLQSPRLDSFIAAAYNLSRAQSQKLISQEGVKLNHTAETRADRNVLSGDIISIRGLGRIKVDEMLGETRRGRLAAMIFKYGAKRKQ